VTDEPRDADERVDQIILEYLEEVDAGRQPDRRALVARHPDLAAELTAFFADQDRVARMAQPVLATTTDEIGPAAADDEVPEAVGGYRLLRLLGAGGMGRVYEAEGPGGERVAVKLLSPGVADSPTALERFRQEGRLASRVAHPRCVFVRTADQDAGRPYIVMELMTGATLKDLVEGAGPLEPAQAVAHVLDVIEGLEEAHHAGVLHRDVKPANCYLDADGRVKVGDFGLSRSVVAASHLTRTGGFVGTPLFASPEQLKGERLDARTDVYSVAATLYYLLTGRAPFQHADGATVVARAVSEAPPPPSRLRPGLPPALEEVVLRGLERARERRYPDLAALREALLPMLPGQMTIAGLSLRVGAYLLDSLPFTICGEVLGLSQLKHGFDVSRSLMLGLTAPVFLYFWLSDGLWGRSVGKWLLRLRVTRAGGGERPGLGRALLRTAVFVATGGLLTNMALYAVVGPDKPLVLALGGLPGVVLSLAVRFSTMRKRNGYRGLHEMLSDTRVVQLPPPRRAGREPFAPGDVAAAPAVSPIGDGVPAQVGVFAIRGVLRRDGDEMLLLGEDTTLGRHAWVWWRPRTAEPLPPARRDLTRGERLRWLSGGTDGDARWDAFMAPQGAGLAEAVAASGPLDWPAARLLLDGLADELHAAAADGTLPARLSIQQVWLGPNGRVQLLDRPLTGPHEVAAPGDEPALALLRQAAALALGTLTPLSPRGRGAGGEGKDNAPSLQPLSPEGRGEDCPTRAIVPLHARWLLARLAGGPDRYRRLADLRADLAATRARPTEVTPVLRAMYLAIAFCFVGFGASITLGWSRNGALAHALMLDHAMVQAQALQAVLGDDELAAPLVAELPPDDPLRTAPQEQARFLGERRARDGQELEALVASLGWLEYVAQTVPQLRMRRALGGADEPLRVERRPGEPYAVEVTRLRIPEAQPLVLDLGELEQTAARARGEASDAVPEALWPVVGMILVALVVVPLVFVASAVIFRGGLSLRLAGLALVRSGGRDALRVQCAWRVAVVWLPVVAVLVPVLWIDLRRTDLLWLCPILQGLAILLLLVPAALALRFPRRSLPDWLAGTWVVPR
jgi:hypothetical protein